MSYKGWFTPKNPNKYKGDSKNVVYRSSWELRVMKWLDENPSVIWWASEELIIKYKSPIDQKMHRYFPDFYLKKKNIEGKIETVVIEVKPKNQVVPPTVVKTKTNKPTKRYVREVMTYGVNEAKWKAAQAFCEDRKWKFMIMTESELGIK